jgi:hypothetical protein
MGKFGRTFWETISRLNSGADAGEVRRCSVLDALLTELDDQQIRDFIMGNERPELESEFEKWLWKLGFKDVTCRTSEGGQAVEITFNFDAQPEPPRTHIHSFLNGIARELKPGFSCGTILYTGRGRRLIASFRFEPRRTGMDQFRRYRERRA